MGLKCFRYAQTDNMMQECYFILSSCDVPPTDNLSLFLQGIWQFLYHMTIRSIVIAVLSVFAHFRNLGLLQAITQFAYTVV